MATVEYRETTCDSCGDSKRQPVGVTGLPEGWQVGYLGPEPNGEYLAGAFKDLCPKCAERVEEAMRPRLTPGRKPKVIG